MLAGRLDAIAVRHARWGDLSEDQKAAGAAELREIASDRPGLLAETAGLALGTAEGKGPEFEARGQAVAELCRMVGADEDLIPQWAEEGRRRAEAAKQPPFSEPSPRTQRRPLTRLSHKVQMRSGGGRMRLLPYVAGGQGGMSGGLLEVAVIVGLVLAGVVKLGLRHGWRHLTAPKGRHRHG